ncbi:uncharacterized protein MEPE_01444 [Melanopsichium pennsylvanicum]|uniref:ELYS-like domain-containing protein n=2 Tax=Melanopsichium pennsylvanicum TaxID=63383 RepID=A0AAJ5C3P2_9BASI|nr:conserved hypothetical protein [Melanopsichium pennsylvanicum 4]SNX82738.1 uncharacterized protein MEPE_01444 [Melanopsichium pennsylvanicum]
MSAQSVLSPQNLQDEAAALAADILPIFTSTASIQSSWSSKRITFINERRSTISGRKLFFDELLSFASVDASLYPPSSTDQLSALLKAIFAATTLDYLKQLSLVYYLLLDFDAYSQPSSEHASSTIASTAESFADNYVILPHFTDAMQGYWLLDNDQYEQAIPLLVVADFIPKIIRTLYLPSPNNQRSEVARAKLLLRFLRTSNQTTTSPPGSDAFLDEIEMQIQALCFVSGPARAISEIRKLTFAIQDDEQQRVSVRARLIFKVLQHCFAPPRPAAINNLLACSLDAEEEITLERFVLSPPAAMTATWSYVAADVLIVRYISQGRYMDAVGLDRRLGPDVGQGHTTAKDAQQRSKLMEQRKRMIAGARQILPEVQKELLRIEESVEISGGIMHDKEEHKVNSETSKGGNASIAVNELEDRSILALTPLSASPAARRSKTHTPSTQAAILSAVVRASASPSAPSTSTKVVVPSVVDSPVAGSLVGTPGRSGTTPNHPVAMLGFLAKNALSGKPFTSDLANVHGSANNDHDDDVLVNDLEEMDGSAVLVSKPVESAKTTSSSATRAASPPTASPWRNQPTLTSSSPFSGLPKLTRPNNIPGNASVASGSRSSPYHQHSSPHATAFQPANTSPFASIRSLPSLTTSGRGGGLGGGRKKLTGALEIVSQHGKKSRLGGRGEESISLDDDDDDDMVESDPENEHRYSDQDDVVGAEGEEFGDDTFIQTQTRAKIRGNSNGNDASIGRLVPGRRGWNEAQQDNDNAAFDARMDDDLNAASKEPPAKRRTRNKTTAAATFTNSVSATESKLTRSRTGTNLADVNHHHHDGEDKSNNKNNNKGGDTKKISKSRTETNLAGRGRGGVGEKRMTRSTSAVNRRPLTLSNLEQFSRVQQGTQRGVASFGDDDAGAGDGAPIARRTRAATAELESVNEGSQVTGQHGDGGASTIYTISEIGDNDHDVDDGQGKPMSRSLNKRNDAQKKTTTPKSKRTGGASRGSVVRRSSRLSSVEPEGGIMLATEMSEISSPAKRRGGGGRGAISKPKIQTLPTSSSAVTTRGGSSHKMPGGLE